MDLNDPLVKSLLEEREMLLTHRLRLTLALKEILKVVDEPDEEQSAENALTQIGNIAEAALIL